MASAHRISVIPHRGGEVWGLVPRTGDLLWRVETGTRGGMVPTPVLYFATHHLGAASGVMVTGSHIPADRNGLKFYLPGGEIAKSDEAAIEHMVREMGLSDEARRRYFRPQGESGEEQGWCILPEAAALLETAEQAEMLRHLGCPEVQGFHFARPMNPQRYLERAQKAAQS